MKRIVFIVLVLCAVLGSCKNSTPTTPTAPIVVKVYPKIDSFIATQMSIFPNTVVTLSWSTKDATRIVITPYIGDVAASGTRQINLTETTTFTLTAENNDGAVTKQVEVKVDLQDPCNTIYIAYYLGHSTYYHVETSTNIGTYDVANVEITVILYGATDTVIDWGKGIIPIIKKGESGKVDVILTNGVGGLTYRSIVAITNCNAMTSQLTGQVRELKIRRK
jgi:hypothetical protein